MTESEIYKKYLKNHLLLTFVRIETGSTLVGIPDVYYYGKETQGWIELKIGRLRKDGAVHVNYRPRQVAFLRELQTKHLKAFTLIFFNGFLYLTNNTKGVYRNENELKETSLWKGDNFSDLNLLMELTDWKIGH